MTMPPRPTRPHALLRVFIALGLPALMVLGLIPALGASSARIMGVPLAVFAMFCCFVLLPLCMGCVWLVFDRHQGEQP